MRFYIIFYFSVLICLWPDIWYLEKKKKLATVVEGYSKAPFSIATTPRCREGRQSFPMIVPIYPWAVPYNAVC